IFASSNLKSEPRLATIIAKIDIPAGEISDDEIGDDRLVSDVLQAREFQLDLYLCESAARDEAKTNQRPAQLHEKVNYRKRGSLHRKVARQSGDATFDLQWHRS